MLENNYFIKFINFYITVIDNIRAMEMTDDIFKKFYEEKKVIVEDIGWKIKKGIYETDHTPIISSILEEETITLKCKVDKYNKYAFNIIFRKTIPLVRYDKKIHGGNFVDRCSGQKLDEPHKHKFKKGCKKDLEAKIISDAEISRDDVNKALLQFLEECNIRLEGNYNPLVLPQKGYIQKSIYQFADMELEHLKNKKGKNEM